MNKSQTSMAKFFQSSLIGHSLFQNVDFPTHVSENTLDLIITKDNSSLVSNCSKAEISVSDIYAINLNSSSQLYLKSYVKNVQQTLPD